MSINSDYVNKFNKLARGFTKIIIPPEAINQEIAKDVIDQLREFSLDLNEIDPLLFEVFMSGVDYGVRKTLSQVYIKKTPRT